MKILGIETSCDETAVCVLEASGKADSPRFRVLGDALYSQAATHAEYGGVFPSLAKREHARNLVPLLEKAVGESVRDSGVAAREPSERVRAQVGLAASEVGERGTPLPLPLKEKLSKILEREPGLAEQLIPFIERTPRPNIDAIAVTSGPGLEPALWVGINFARALGVAWDIPVHPSNHMEGHIASVLLKEDSKVEFPAVALLISGGHTELVLMKDWLDYEVIGRTKDDAVGEAFDKVARVLSLPYPGGPHVSKLAAEARTAHTTPSVKFPRPMLKTPDLDFSFSGLKTAVLYATKKTEMTDATKREFSLEFENAVTEVLVEKTKMAVEYHDAKTLILGGGVVANSYIRERFKIMTNDHPGTTLLLPELAHSTDNAVMIAVAGYLNILAGKQPAIDIKAEGNLSFKRSGTEK